MPRVLAPSRTLAAPRGLALARTITTTRIIDSVFMPSDLPNLALWLSGPFGVTPDTGGISSWASRVAGVVGTQATSGNRPAVSSMNGLQSTGWDGSDDSLSLSSPVGQSDQITIFFVGQVNDLSTSRTILSAAPGVNGCPWYYVQANGALRLNNQNNGGTIGQGQAGRVVSGQRFLSVFTFDRNGGTAGPWAARFNRAADAQGTVSMGAFTNGVGVIGRQGTINPYQGLMSEILIYTRVLSLSEIQQVENYLQPIWGTP